MTLEAAVVLGCVAVLLAVLIIAPFLLDEPTYDDQDDDGVTVVIGDYEPTDIPHVYRATLTPEQTDTTGTIRVVPREP